MSGAKTMSEVRVGAFVLAAMAMLVAGSLWIAGASLSPVPRPGYEIRLDDSGGLQAGDRVRMSGVAVGKIRSVEFHADREPPVSVRVTLQHGMELRQGATARIEAVGVMGSNVLEIDPGPIDADRLEPGGVISGKSAPGIEDALADFGAISERVIALLDRTSALMETVSGDVGPIVTRMDALLSESNVESVQRILSTLDATVAETAPQMASVARHMNTLSASMESGMQEVPRIVDEVDGLVGDLRTALGPDGQRLTDLLEASRRSVETAEELLSSLGNGREDVEDALIHLREAAANVEAFSREIRARPHRLVRRTHPPDRRPGDGVKEGR